MLYKKKTEKELREELFFDPTSEFRAAPFWAWNCELDADLLKKEIEYMKEMGFGGFHMHPRVGMATKYLSDDFMDLIRACVEKAKDEKMLAYLYDEDKWPSGFAGGFVTEPAKIISGGPMMGFAIFDLDVPTTKTASAITCPTLTWSPIWTTGLAGAPICMDIGSTT